MSREDAWAVVVENDRLVKWILRQFVDRITAGGNDYYGYTKNDMFDELLAAAYESMLVAVESFDQSKGYTLSTYAEKVLWRDLTDEVIRWRATTAGQDGDLSIERLLIPQHELVNGNDQWDPKVNEVLQALAVDPFDRIDEQLDVESAVSAVRAALKPLEFAALALTADGFTPKEIAGKLGITNGNARVILHRARDKAREVLEGVAA